MAKTKVPEIRFQGFEGDWEETTIGEIGNFYYGKSAPKWSLHKDAPTQCVRYGELYTKYGAVITKTYSKTNIDPKNLRFSKGGEILVPRVGEKPEDFGKCCCYLTLKGVAIGEMISVFETNNDSLFYTYYFRNKYKEFAKAVEGRNVKNLYYRELEPISIHRAKEFSEQTKIGNYFKNLDKLLSLKQGKLNKLKNLKKSMLEKMFPREGAALPEIRFKGFSGEWEKKTLEEIFTKIRNAFVGTATPYYVEEGHFYLESNNIKDGQINRKSEIFINNEFYSKQKENWLHTDDIVMVQSGHVGHSAVIPPELDNTAAHALIIFSGKIIMVCSYFLNYQFQTSKSKGNIEIITTGNTIKHILSSEMKKFKVLLPQIQEQTKIGSYFKKLDHLISLQQKEIEKLKQIKTSCLSKMFV